MDLSTPFFAGECRNEHVAQKIVELADSAAVHVQVATIRHKIRLAGIDAPERDLPYGAESTLNLSRLIVGEHVTVERRTKDRYGRIVGKILLGDRDICLEQVRAGYGWHSKKYQSE